MGLTARPFYNAGSPMRSLEDTPSEWRGMYDDYSGHGHERLLFTFANGAAKGEGVDKDGEFVYLGVYHPDGEVVLTKVYTRPFVPVPKSMTYRGTWNGSWIGGRWQDDWHPTSNCGPFELWPVDEELAVETLTAEQPEALGAR